MSPFEIQFAATILKVVFCLVLSLHVPALMVWIERRQCAMIQRRVGPNRVGFFQFRLMGLGQSLADVIKLLFKEDTPPAAAHKFYYWLGPIITAGIGLSAFAIIPFGNFVLVAGEQIQLQGINLNAGFLYLLAISSLGVYGITLAGWASNSKYTLLGGMRASAQMISYEIAMGISLIPIVFIYGTLDLNTIVQAQTGYMFGVIPAWGIFKAPVSFVIFLITMYAETNRLPFDLAESESELVAGFHTEHGSMRFALFFLGEYVMMFVLAAFVATLFFGGYEIPYFPQTEMVAQLTPMLGQSMALWAAAIIGFHVLIVKIGFFMLLYVQVRWTFPRFRYDQLMKVGWVYLIPISLINVAVSAIIFAIIKSI